MNTIVKNGKPITIGLLWHSANSSNLGVGALTVSNIAIISDIAEKLNIEVNFKILGWKDPEPFYVEGDNIEVVQLRARDVLKPSGLFSSLRTCDFVLDISAGDSFADIYGARRFILNILAKANVLISRRPLILSPQTIGPFQRWWAILLAGWFMRRAKIVITRDKMSTEYLQNFKLGNQVIEATDVAFRLPYKTPPKHDDGVVKIGLNVSGLLFNGGYSKDNMFSLKLNYPDLVRSIVAYVDAQPNCELHLIGHVNSERQSVEDDYRVSSLLHKEFPNSILAPRFANPSEAKSYISSMDFFAGARMHACIAAFSSGVPVLPMAYSRKFSGLFGTLGYHHLADCRTQTTEEILSIFIASLEQRKDIKIEVDACLKIAQKKIVAYEKVLQSLLVDHS